MSSYSNLCRFCCSNTSFTQHSICDGLVAKFLNFVPSIDLDEKGLSETICQLCYGKTKISFDFITKIISSQSTLKSIAEDKNLQTPNQIVEKMKQISGISVRKVKKETKPEVVVFNYEENVDDVLDRAVENDAGHSSDDDEDFSVQDDSDGDYTAGPSTSKKPRQNKDMTVIETQINFSCGFCKETFSNFNILSDHMKSRNCFTEVFECKECKKQFDSKKKLYAHKFSHQRQQEEKLICEECAKPFSSQFDLTLHIESTHRRVVKKDCIFRCTTCEEKFVSHLDLLTHVKLHATEKITQSRLCEICSKMCANLRAYRAHLETHREKTFICEICNKGFIKNYFLKKHLLTHSGIKLYKCEPCNKSYAKRESLNRHNQKEHSNS